MEEGEKLDLKEKIKKVMLDHLTGLGYPDIPNERIMTELKAMWIKIEEAGLIKEDMNYMAFVQHAQDQFLIAEVKETMGI